MGINSWSLLVIAISSAITASGFLTNINVNLEKNKILLNYITKHLEQEEKYMELIKKHREEDMKRMEEIYKKKNSSWW